MGDKQIMANFTGNGSKSLHVSVEASLAKLQTTYIDLVSHCLLSPFFILGPMATNKPKGDKK